MGGGLYQYEPAAGTNQFYQAASGGTGTIQTGVLEASNVDLSTEFSNMIIAQRGFRSGRPCHYGQRRHAADRDQPEDSVKLH